MSWMRHRESDEMAGLRAEVQSLQGRLAADVSNLDPGEDPMCRQAMTDASERNGAAGALLARATAASEMQVALRIVVEGLQAARVIREHQGLSLGADLPDITTPATVQSPTTVFLGKQSTTAYPEYHPTQPHYFSGGAVGGNQVPGGYYRTPFWQKAMMIGGAVAGGQLLGDLLGGGGGEYEGGGSSGGDWGGGD